MKKSFVAILLPVLFFFTATGLQAQQIPFLNELLARNTEFNKTYTQKRREGKSLPAIEQLRQRGEQEFREGNIAGLLELFGEGLAMLENKPWTEKEKFLTSLSLETNCLVLEPNAELEVSLARMFTASLEKAFANPPVVTFELIPSKAVKGFTPLPIGVNLPVAEAATMARLRVRVPDGEYVVTATLVSGEQKAVITSRPIYAISAFTSRLQLMRAAMNAIKKSTDPKVKALAEQVTTPEFWAQRLSTLTKATGEAPLNGLAELQRLETVVTWLASGKDPFAGERGELERAYLAADGVLVPYRIYVPKSYDKKTAQPLVVLLHGALGDETSYFSNLYDEATIKGEMEKRGWIFVAPNGRGRFSAYKDSGLEDVLRVMQLVTRDYQIDASRIYLSGHSMGGLGTWEVARAHPELFAAIAPVAGATRFQPEALAKLLAAVKPLPIFIVQGAKDGIVPPQASREMFAAAQKAGLNVRYLENPEADHILIVGRTFAEVLNFFEKNKAIDRKQ